MRAVARLFRPAAIAEPVEPRPSPPSDGPPAASAPVPSRVAPPIEDEVVHSSLLGAADQLELAAKLLERAPASRETLGRVGSLLTRVEGALRDLPRSSATQLSPEIADELGQRLGPSLGRFFEHCPPFGVLSGHGGTGRRIMESIDKLGRGLARFGPLPLVDAVGASALHRSRPRSASELETRLEQLDACRALSPARGIRQQLKLQFSGDIPVDGFRVQEQIATRRGELLAEGLDQGWLSPEQAMARADCSFSGPPVAMALTRAGRLDEAPRRLDFILGQGIHSNLSEALLATSKACPRPHERARWVEAASHRVFSRFMTEPSRYALPQLDHPEVARWVETLEQGAELPSEIERGLGHALQDQVDAARSAAGSSLPDKMRADLDRLGTLARRLVTGSRKPI